MFTFIAGIVVIIFSFIFGHFAECPQHAAVRGGKMPFTATAPVEWFDPKTFVIEMEASAKDPARQWHIGPGIDPTQISRWEPVVAEQWAAQVQKNDREGFCIANGRYTLRWQDWQQLPDERGTRYMREYRADLATVKGENSFIMTPYLREWQRCNLWNWIPERSRLLDIGVGTGRSKDLWFAKHLRVWGVEPNEGSIEKLRHKKLPCVQALEPWGGEDPRIQTWLPKGGVDTVMMSYSITFFFHSPERLDHLVANIRHALGDRPGSRFVLIGMDGERVDQWFQEQKKQKSNFDKDVLDTPLFTIKKKYRTRAAFGSEIEITMKNPNTLVEAQQEYLVDFNHLRKVMQKAGYKCLKDERVRAPGYLGEWTGKFVEAQRLLVFEHS
jgi:uncharacterized protein YacL (UPF0231 family)